jgi:hypothetical protein
MKRLLVFLVLGLCLVLAAQAQWRFGDPKVQVTRTESDAVVDTVMANVNSDTYFLFSAPTGFRFTEIHAYCITPSEDSEACKLRFWYSATDSTSLNLDTGGHTSTPIQIVAGSKYTTAAGGFSGEWVFPITCTAVSVTEHADTDDFVLVGFMQRY